MTRLATSILLALAACSDNSSIRILADGLDFGQTDCGATAIPRALVVTNPTQTAFEFTTSLAAGGASPYTIVPASGQVLAYDEVQIMVISNPIPAASAVTDNLYGDTLTLTTTLAGDEPHSVAIKQTAHGAILQVGAPTVAFATPLAVGATPASMPITITNTGNAATAVTVTSPSASFALTPSGPQMIAPAATLSGQLAFAPRVVGAIDETLAITATGPSCAPPPTLEATATGTLTGTAVAVAFASTKGRPNPNGGDFQLFAGNTGAMCVLTSSGFVACAGSNQNGMRGDADQIPDPTTFNLVRTATGTLDDAVEITGGRGFFCARRRGGQLACWGDYLGLGRRAIGDTRSFNPTATDVIASGVTSVASGYAYTCSIGGAGGALSCFGQPTGSSVMPVGGWTLTGATAVSNHGAGGYALMTDGTVMSFGENSRGERGNADAAEAPPSAVTGLSGVVQVAAGGGASKRGTRHGCAVETDGSAWCWGKNRHGELGDGATVDTATPAQVMTDTDTPLTGVTAVSAAQAHSCAIADAVYCWGRASEGELGGGETGDTSFATQTVPAITNAKAITSSGRGTCAVLATGAVRCWGDVIGNVFAAPTAIVEFEP